MRQVEAYTEEWLDARKSLVTATDVVTLMDFNEYSSPADLWWYKKSGYQVPDNGFMWFGRSMEEPIAEKVREITGRSFVDAKALFVSDKYPWLAATPDRVELDDKNAFSAVLEIKTSQRHDAWGDFPAMYAYVQALTQSIVIEAPSINVGACLYGHGEPKVLVYADLPRDELMIEDIITLSYEFYESLKSDKPPGKFSYEVAKKAFRATTSKQKNLSPDAIEALARIKEMKKKVAMLYKDIEADSALVMQELEDAEVGVFDGSIAVTWKETSATTIDVAALRKIAPEVAVQAERTSVSRRFLVK